ncbi:MAG: glycosyltransferase family 87 protein [Anaerolineae bacterium]|nr:glycosyltransferase family 87 protein [Anaerolineae bacterium]
MSIGPSAPARPDGRTVFAAAALFALLTLAFYASPWDGGDDWETFRGAAWRILDAAPPLYGEPVTHAYYSNPPWLAVLCIPLALLPFRLGWAALAAATLGVALLLLRRWNRQASLVKPVLVLLSPPMFYTIMHGQVDLLIIGGVLLPAQWWALVALTKPQAALGLLAGVPRALAPGRVARRGGDRRLADLVRELAARPAQPTDALCGRGPQSVGGPVAVPDSGGRAADYDGNAAARRAPVDRGDTVSVALRRAIQLRRPLDRRHHLAERLAGSGRVC